MRFSLYLANSSDSFTFSSKKHNLPQNLFMPTVALSIDNRIAIQEGILGGQPHIVNRRIRVKDIVQWYDLLNLNADEIAATYELELADVFAALAYYHLNRVVLQQIWAQDEKIVEELRNKMPSKVKPGMNG
jgi:uncharacterized protein (DUF433 family)